MNGKVAGIKFQLKAANGVLRKNLARINSTEEWAMLMKWNNTAQFSRSYRRAFGKRPSDVLLHIKLETAITLLQTRPELSCFQIAEQIGKADDKALNKYLKYHTGRVPSWFKANKDYIFSPEDIISKNNNKRNGKL